MGLVVYLGDPTSPVQKRSVRDYVVRKLNRCAPEQREIHIFSPEYTGCFVCQPGL